MDTPRPSPRTNRTRRVPHPVLIGHAASLSQVLQFSCHGELHGLWLSDGKVDRSALVSSLKEYNRSPQTKEGVRLLIITACISGPLAEELSAFVDFVIGHGLEEVRDSDAIEFTHTLYRSLGQGRSLEESFTAAHLASPAFRLVARRANPRAFFIPTPESSDALNERLQEMEREQDRLQRELQKQHDRLEQVLSSSSNDLSHFFVHAPFSVEEWTRDRGGHAKDDDEERSELGEGQFGTTVRMKARTKIEGADVEAGKLFAVKTFMLKKIRKYKASEEMVKHEANVLKSLRHRNIIRCFHLFCEEREFHLVMEIALGGTLAEKIDGTPLDQEQVMKWTRQLASAFSYMHSQGVCHRDVKPENLLLSERDTIKVSRLSPRP